MEKYLVIYRRRNYKNNGKYENYGIEVCRLEKLINVLNEDSTERINELNWREALERDGKMLIAVIPSWLPDDFEPDDFEQPSEKAEEHITNLPSAVLKDPVSVIEISSGIVVENIYRSDLPAWEKQGYEIYLPSLND